MDQGGLVLFCWNNSMAFFIASVWALGEVALPNHTYISERQSRMYMNLLSSLSRVNLPSIANNSLPGLTLKKKDMIQ